MMINLVVEVGISYQIDSFAGRIHWIFLAGGIKFGKKRTVKWDFYAFVWSTECMMVLFTGVDNLGVELRLLFSH